MNVSLVLEVLEESLVLSEDLILSFKQAYKENSKKLSTKVKKDLSQRHMDHLDGLVKMKELYLKVQESIEEDDKQYVFRICNLILALADFIVEDCKDIELIFNGKKREIIDKMSLH